MSAFCNSVFAQIEVGSGGRVSIGGYSVSTTATLSTGSAKFNGNVGIGADPDAAINLVTPTANFTTRIGIGATPNTSYSLTSNNGIFNTNLKVTGSMGVGTDANTTYKLDVLGLVRFQTSMNDLIINNNGWYGFALYPESDKSCNLGLSNKAFRYVYTQELIETSDARQKENIRAIENPLVKIMKIKPVKYDFKLEYATNPEINKSLDALKKIEKDRKDKIGFLAQDLQKILPEVVNYDDTTDVYSISYTRIIPVLVGAIQEQQKQIEGLKAEVEALMKEVNSKSLTMPK